MDDEVWSGGCQCGAVRYRISGRPENPCICHCRMCQKQFGSFFGAFALAHSDAFHLTRGEPGWFQSSDDARRGFCRDCGSPLLYQYLSSPQIGVALGSLDRHSELKPELQVGVEAREPWFAELHQLPELRTGEGENGYGDTPERMEKIRASNRQHPDHDMTIWPPR
ncbi:MAG: GFA family protein [Tabrizicola sp.]|nr:GFA family protein [Tabrizicola sp.]